MISRRQFLKLGAGAAVGLALSSRSPFGTPLALAYYQSGGLQKYVQSLRGVGPGGIPVALPDGTSSVTGATHYSIRATQYTDTLHTSLGPTTLWGYSPAKALGEGDYPTRHLGGIIVAQRNVPIQLTVTNVLPPTHILPVDTSGPFPDAAAWYGNSKPAFNAITTHLHGGFVPWISDGGPMTWFDPNGHYGSSAKYGSTNIYKLLNPGLRNGQGEYYYPNQQSARMMWYHDHAHDITRLNAYAGIATAYIIRDDFESHLRNVGLPDYVENGGREIPIVIQDKIFVDAATINKLDPTWKGLTSTGSLWYPHVYEPDRWEIGDFKHLKIPNPSCIPEMFGDTMLANGTVFPEVTVEARRYRLRILNACQARFLNLQLYVEDNSGDSITLVNPITLDDGQTLWSPSNQPGPDFLVIGTEGGFLPKPVIVPSHTPFFVQEDAEGDPIASTIRSTLLTAPAERWDIIVDFNGFAGKKIILYNDAPAPFPGGDPANDHLGYKPGDPNSAPAPGYGPNTRQIMRFNVTPPSSADPPMGINPGMNLATDLDPFLVPPGVSVIDGTVHLPPGVPVRQLTLSEDFDGYGRLIQRLGTNIRTASDPTGTPTNGQAYMDPPTEVVTAGSTEVWQITNMTGDTHPIHFHLANVQVLARQPFDHYDYGSAVGQPGAPAGLGPARGPDSTELGWKETVKIHPGELMYVIMKFAFPTVPFAVPASPMGGAEYVWHCHILEHEEHDMMRPMIVM